jgi:hypothetical protein
MSVAERIEANYMKEGIEGTRVLYIMDVFGTLGKKTLKQLHKVGMWPI